LHRGQAPAYLPILLPLEQANALHASRLAALRAEFAVLWQTWPAEITLEIGCGHGHFLNAYAQAHPGEHCLGLDLLADRIARAQKKARRAGLTNLAFFHAEARLLLEALPAPVRLGRIFILFPDPWPKRRHHKNRIMQPEFLQTLATRAGQGTRLCFRTDYLPYFEAARATLRDHPAWQLVEEPWPFEHETVFQSRADSYHSFLAQPAAPSP
jgi:tRNA (guanine-N7-)-methyltransferase